MPAGLQVWDASGVKVLDTNDRIGRILGRLEIAGSGSLVDARFSTGTPFLINADFSTVTYIFGFEYDTFDYSFSGNTLSWRYDPIAEGILMHFYYGVF